VIGGGGGGGGGGVGGGGGGGNFLFGKKECEEKNTESITFYVGKVEKKG